MYGGMIAISCNIQQVIGHNIAPADLIPEKIIH
jgi:hypothetical protein